MHVIDSDLSTIPTTDLIHVCGGSKDPGQDFANEAAANTKMAGGHYTKAWNAAKSGHVTTAIKEGVAGLYDTGHSIVSAAKHASGLWDFAKDAVHTVADGASLFAKK
jgi:hypothetical protein